MKLKGTIENLHISYELQESTLIMWSTVDDRVRWYTGMTAKDALLILDLMARYAWPNVSRNYPGVTVVRASENGVMLISPDGTPPASLLNNLPMHERIAWMPLGVDSALFIAPRYDAANNQWVSVIDDRLL
jgi:hypothetical protein